MINFALRLIYPPGKELSYPLKRMTVGHYSRCEALWIGDKSVALTGIRTTFPRKSIAEPHHDALHAVSSYCQVKGKVTQ
jgi:hypothetical protein